MNMFYLEIRLVRSKKILILATCDLVDRMICFKQINTIYYQYVLLYIPTITNMDVGDCCKLYMYGKDRLFGSLLRKEKLYNGA